MCAGGGGGHPRLIIFVTLDDFEIVQVWSSYVICAGCQCEYFLACCGTVSGVSAWGPIAGTVVWKFAPATDDLPAAPQAVHSTPSTLHALDVVHPAPVHTLHTAQPALRTLCTTHSAHFRHPLQTALPLCSSKERVRPDDFLVLKMDIEAVEYQLIPAMIERGLFPYVDEFFVEFHFAELHRKFPAMAEKYGRRDSVKLLQRLRDMGIYCHEWF